MKKNIIISLAISLSLAFSINAQRVHGSSGMEFIFGGAQIENNDGSDTAQAVRFSAFFHLQQHIYYDITKTIGLYSGVAVRNVGFITKNGDFTSKHRIYTAGIPLALTVGDLKKHFFFYAGAEAGLAISYKEKEFNGDIKTKKNLKWFSGKVNAWQPMLFTGVQFPYGANVKFAYYPQNFFNKNYSQTEDGVSVKPYENTNVNLFYVSISFQLFGSDAKKLKNDLEPTNRTAYR